MTFPTLGTRESYNPLVPYRGRLPERSFPYQNRWSVSETESLEISGLVDSFFYTCTTVTSLPRGGSGSSFGPLQQSRERGLVSHDDTHTVLCCLDVPTQSPIDGRW